MAKDSSIKSFCQRWKNRGDEKSDTQKFWLELLRDVLNVENPENFIDFEKRVIIDNHSGYIDVYVPSTGIVIEQKSNGINLDYVSGSNRLTPFEQARNYYNNLIFSERGRYIITCNFQELRIYDMNEPGPKAKIIKLSDLPRSKDSLSFIITPEKRYSHEELISIKAGALTQKLFAALRKRYINDKDKASRISLHILCVRIVFLLYAEDAGVFRKSQFHDYLKARKIAAREALIKLFEVLSLKTEQRDPYLEDDLKNFPFVNGGLFDENNIEIPKLDGEPVRIILEDMSEQFDWSDISPTIFGAIFESVFAKHEESSRESEGMHYTSPENIHKLIDPLFMNDINEKLKASVKANDTAGLQSLHDELASYRFFDPACGSGNFLTETFISLRRIENKIIKALQKNNIKPEIKISINQFYGLELEDFAVNVARTALYIANIQMLAETRNETGIDEPSLPLIKIKNIHKGNALNTDWRTIITPSEKLFVIGNPPFIGYAGQTPDQKKEIRDICGESASAGKIDYVSGWYYKAAEFMKDSGARAAFVSTNSIIQGDQVYSVWETLRAKNDLHIDFARQSFKWDNESPDKKNQAHVYVVIIGFSLGKKDNTKLLYTPEGVREVGSINFYLTSGRDDYITRNFDEALDPRAKKMIAGGKRTDGGNLVMTHEEMQELIAVNPDAVKLIRPYMMGIDFINRKPRYCLWLVNANPDDIAKCPRVMQRIKSVKEFRLESSKAATRRKAETPALFDEIVECESNYIAVPKTSSSGRKYIPIGFLDSSIIPGDELRIIPGASLYDFGVLTSRVHMAWMRRVAGRLGMGYRYSNTIVYNTFAWPFSSVKSDKWEADSDYQKHRARIEKTAQMILDARAKFAGTSFANLYNDDIMPDELKRAHAVNDAAVCEAYGWSRGISEEDIVGELFERYYELVKLREGR